MKKSFDAKRYGLLFSLAVSLLFSFFLYFNVFAIWNNPLNDSIYQKERELGSDIVIVGVDDASLEALGQWPWPRSYHGLLLKAIDSGEPKAVGVDLLLIEESEEDEMLADLLAPLSQKPVFACYGTLDERARRHMLMPQKMNKPIAEVRDFVDLAHVNTIPDSDKLLRRTYLYIGDPDSHDTDGRISSFALTLAEKASGKSLNPPTDARMSMPIRYAGKTGTFEQVPYYMVLNGEIDPEYFRDKVVLIGVTAVGQADVGQANDYYFTPIAPAYPMYGVEIHANIVEQLLRGLTWEPVPKAVQIIILFVLTVLVAHLLTRMSIVGGVVTVAALSAAFYGTAVTLAAQQKGYLLDLIYPLSSMVVMFVLTYMLRYVAEFMERKRVTSVFSRYMEPRLVERLLKEGAELGGERRELSVLFIDIRGFTPMSENLEPEQVVGILNEYLELTAQAIFKSEGTLDKYIGDAAMALFGAPLELEDHAFKAIEAALYIEAGSDELSKKLLETYGRTVSFGVGINTGEAIVGNIGALHRMDYTAIGDTVNTAARLESNAAPGQILISRATYERVKDRIEVNPLGELKVKGKSQVIETFEVLGLKQQEVVSNTE